MWALPNIQRLNAQAKAEAPDFAEQVRFGFKPIFRQRIEANQLSLLGGASEPALGPFFDAHPDLKGKPYFYSDGILTVGEPLECYCADFGGGGGCSGPQRHYLWYDIFSDDPKGVLTLCEGHDGYYGSPTEGYFTCGDCGRVMIDNYTWELYYVDGEDGQVCLPCAAKQYIADKANWLELTEESIAAIDFERVRQAKHVIGVEMPIPEGIKFFANAEFDATDGHQISGDSIQDILRDAMAKGHEKAILILDAGYQFAVSVGVYVPLDEVREVPATGQEPCALQTL